MTPASSSRQEADVGLLRAQPPIRWPRPDRAWIGLVVLWAAGGVVALFVPAFIVSPSAPTAASGRVWAAFGCTVVGALIMLGTSLVLWRRRGDSSVLVMGVVPAFATIAGGAILAASKLTGT